MRPALEPIIRREFRWSRSGPAGAMTEISEIFAASAKFHSRWVMVKAATVKTAPLAALFRPANSRV